LLSNILKLYIMTKENIPVFYYFTPKTEEIMYLEENELLTPEQQKINDSYEAEWRDRVEHGPQYGPGKEQFKQTAGAIIKVGAKIAISTVVSGVLVAATGGVGAIVVGGIVSGGGYVVKKVGESSDSKVVEFIGDTVFDTGLGTITGGVLGSASSSLVSQGTKSIGKEASKEIAINGGKMTPKAISLIKTGQNLVKTSKGVKGTYDVCGLVVDGWEVHCRRLHGKHIDEGQSYKEDCLVCQGKI
jgi:hypothetical protein